MQERTIVLYHGGCPDGFGGAFAAWKKFGDSAEYIPLHRGEALPEGIDGGRIYIIDFTYKQELMDELLKRGGSLTVIDHHEGVRSIVETMPDYIFDPGHSGAVLAWKYFHPEIPVPYFFQLLEDQDLFRMKLPDTVPLHAYIETRHFDFGEWDSYLSTLEDPSQRDLFLEKARTYAEYFETLAMMAANKGKLVSFEGYEIYFGTSHPFKSLKSRVGNLLVERKGPISLVVTAHPNGYGVSIRGDGSVNVAEIAQKYGGNGHPNSSGFLIPREGPFPWELIEDHEDSSH